MENDELKYPMGGSNRVNKIYNTNPNNSTSNSNTHSNPGSVNQSFNNQNNHSTKKVNFNHNVKNDNLNEQQLFNTFQNGFLRNATNFNIGNGYINPDDQENELLSLALKTPDQSKALLNIFIKDFLDKSGMSKTGKIFEMEQGGEIKQDYDFLIDMERDSIKGALEIKRSFLNEWWQIFWDVFNAKAHKNGSKIAQEYYSFNISRKNLDFLCRQASMKAAFEQQILERKGEYQKEAFKQQAGNPLGFNPFFGAGFENFQAQFSNQAGPQQKPNTSQNASNPKSNEFQFSPSKYESFESMAFNNPEVLNKIKEQQQIIQQQNRQWKNEVEFGVNGNNLTRQNFQYNSAQGSPANVAVPKMESSFVDEDNVINNTNGHDVMGQTDYVNMGHGAVNSVPRSNMGNHKGSRRTSVQTQQIVQQRLNKITPLVKQNEYQQMPNNNGMMKVKNGNMNATTPLSNVHGNYFHNPRSAVSCHSNSGLKNMNENDVAMSASAVNTSNNGLVSYLTAYDEQLMSMEQRLMGSRMNKNGSSANSGSKSAN